MSGSTQSGVEIPSPRRADTRYLSTREARLATPRFVHIVWHRGKETTRSNSTADFRCLSFNRSPSSSNATMWRWRSGRFNPIGR